MIRKFEWWLAMAVLALAGCSVGPRYQRPDIPTPSHWKQSSGDEAIGSDDTNAAKTSSAGETSSAPGAAGAWPSAAWWHGFGSAQLDDYIAQAQQNNDDLAVAV